MKTKRILASAVLGIVCVFAASAQTAASLDAAIDQACKTIALKLAAAPKAAVLSFSTSASTTDGLSVYVLGEMRKTLEKNREIAWASQKDIDAALSEENVNSYSALNTSIARDIGKKLGAAFIVTGTLRQSDKDYSFRIMMMDVADGSVVGFLDITVKSTAQITQLLEKAGAAQTAAPAQTTAQGARTSASASPFKRGADDFVYTGYEPLKDKPVTIFSYVPTRGDITKMRVLIAIHGDGRGRDTRNMWKELAEADGFIVIAPEFQEQYYDYGHFLVGGVCEERTSSPYIWYHPTGWIFSIIEPIFDYFVSSTGSSAKTYDMFGHSSGGMLLHRYLLAMPQARVNVAVIANPAVMTFPTSTDSEHKGYHFPFTLQSSPFDNERYLRAFLARRMYVCLGSIDDKPTFGGIGATEQGNGRYERGKKFFSAAKAEAERLKMPFNWKLSIVDNVGYDQPGMIYGGEKWDAGQRNYSVGARTGAYYLIFQENKEVSTSPMPAQPRYATENNVSYIDEEGAKKAANNVTVIDSKNITEFGFLDGWYLIRGNLTRNKPLWVFGGSGKANIILENGGSLTVKGVTVPAGNSLTIYAQSADEKSMGKLTATGCISAAGIGGPREGDAGNITIAGGIISATGGMGPKAPKEWNNGGAGIGGGFNGSGGIINITGGIITAKGGEHSAGIGGGYHGISGDITISGGTVTATACTAFDNSGAAGIGGGFLGNRIGGEKTTVIGKITINGGTVTATGGDFGPGIGDAFGGLNTIITINSGTVTATGGYRGAGIGAGREANGGDVIINGGTVTATGGGTAAGIGGGYATANSGNITITGGTVTAIGGSMSAGIGSGPKAVKKTTAGNITITGGTITAKGGKSYGFYGAGIGGGSKANGGTITIGGGTITATGGSENVMGIGGGGDAANGGKLIMNGNAVVFASSLQNKYQRMGRKEVEIMLEVDISEVTNGILFDGAAGRFYGRTVTLSQDVTIPAAHTLTIPGGATLIVPAGIKFIDNGTVTNNGTLKRN